MPDLFPFGIYDTKQCGMAHIGLYKSEADCWQVFLGWPSPEEIEHATSKGLRALPLTISYDPKVL